MYCSVIRSMVVAIHWYKYTCTFVESKLDIVMILFHTTIKLPQMVPFLIAGHNLYHACLNIQLSGVWPLYSPLVRAGQQGWSWPAFQCLPLFILFRQHSLLSSHGGGRQEEWGMYMYIVVLVTTLSSCSKCSRSSRFWWTSYSLPLPNIPMTFLSMSKPCMRYSRVC